VLSSYDIRLVRYTPNGARIGVVPVLSLESVRAGDVPTVRFSVSSIVAGTFPQYIEVAVEWWRGDRWEEGRDHRFFVDTDEADDKDPAGVQNYVGVGFVPWFLGKAVMEGVPINTYSGGSVRPNLAATNVTGADVVGQGHTRFTRAGHGLVDGDSVVVTAAGNSKLRRNARYWVVGATSNTFELRGSVKGPRITALEKKQTNVKGLAFSRVQDRILINHGMKLNDRVRFLSAPGAGLSGDQSYYVVRPFAANYFGVSSQAGGAPIMLQSSNGISFYTDHSRDRSFRTATPGALMHLLLTEAKARGWGPEVTWNFTATHDSAGVPWAQKVQGIDGTPFRITAGTNLRQILQMLRDQGLVETYSTTRELRMFNPGTGVDRAVSPNPVKVGRGAVKLPVNRERTRILTHLTGVGEGNIIVTASETAHAFGLGRLEGWETLSGIASKNLATELVKTDLAKIAKPLTEYRLTEPGPTAEYLPGIDYNRGDWVKVLVGGTWTSLRVVELVTTKKPDGTVEVSTVFDSRRKSLLTRIAQRQAAASGGVSRGGDGRAIEVRDTRRPAIPTSLVAETVGEFTDTGSAVARVTSSWMPVISDEDGGALDIAGYEVWIRTEGDDAPVRAGATEGLSLTSGTYPTGETLYVSVRAQSISGTWSEFTEEETVTAGLPLAAPLTPTPPTPTAKLGQVRVTWDGNVVDVDGDILAPPAGFAFVYVTMSSTEDGEYVPVGSNMGNAGSVSLSGLPRGETRWFRLQSVTTVGVVSAPSPAVSVTVTGVEGPDIEANSITANELAVGAVTAEVLSLGAAPSRGTPTDRVPAPLTDTEYWGARQTGAISFGEPSNFWSSTPNGIVLSPTSLSFANVAITRQNPVPPSRRLNVQIAASSPAALVVVGWWRADGTTGVATISPGVTWAFPSDATSYRVQLRAEAGSAPVTVAAAQVFEVIGSTGVDQQGVYIDPSGLRLTNEDGSGAIDLSTNSDQYFSIMARTDTGYEAVASIDQFGAGYFADLSVDDEVNVRGTDLLGGFEDILRNGEQDEGAVFDRLARGVVTSGYVILPGVGYSDLYRIFGVIPFEAQPGRRYKITIDASVSMLNDAGQGAAWIEVLLSPEPLAITATSGYAVLRSTSFVPSDGVKTDQINLSRPMVAGATSAVGDTTLAAGRNYVTIRMRTTGGGRLRLAPGGPVAAVAIEDIGPALATYFQFTKNEGSGAVGTGGSTPTPVASSTTRQIAATWSRTWTGGSVLSGTGTYTNGKMLYQGETSGLRWSYFGFPALGISGRTLSSCRLFLQNRHFWKSSGGVARLGTHGFGSPPADRTSRQNAFDIGWGRGQGKWVNVPSNLWPGIASGAIRGFSLGTPEPGQDDFGYFDGVGASKIPNLLITYK
jgi:hypothetical protein